MYYIKMVFFPSRKVKLSVGKNIYLDKTAAIPPPPNPPIYFEVSGYGAWNIIIPFVISEVSL